MALERHGVLERVPGARGLRMAGARGAPAWHRVPLIGRVAAGVPLLAVEDVQDVVDVPAGLFRHIPDVLLRVEGESMVGAGILDGDLIAVRVVPIAESGAIVVARLHDEITVKRLRRRGRRTELLAENPRFETIVVSHDTDFAIEGVVVGVLRQY